MFSTTNRKYSISVSFSVSFSVVFWKTKIKEQNTDALVSSLDALLPGTHNMKGRRGKVPNEVSVIRKHCLNKILLCD